MQYKFATLHCRPWTVLGMTPPPIESHYDGIYGTALRRLNALTTEIDSLDLATAPPGALNRLKHDQAMALNSTLLHEFDFASLGGDGRAVPEPLAKALEGDFGSVGRWRQEFIALAEGMAGGSGWVILSWVPRDGCLINQIGSDHTQSVAGAVPILAIDMYEHAYHLDFGTNAPAYVATFMRNIDWAATLGRYEDAIKVAPPRPLYQKEFADVPAITPEEVKSMIDAGTQVQIVDARPRRFTTKSSEIMSGAVWRDPERLDDWIGQLSKETPVVTYCVHGFHIGCQTAIALREKGIDARYMAGGHYAWKAIGGRMQQLEQG